MAFLYYMCRKDRHHNLPLSWVSYLAGSLAGFGERLGRRLSSCTCPGPLSSRSRSVGLHTISDDVENTQAVQADCSETGGHRGMGFRLLGVCSRRLQITWANRCHAHLDVSFSGACEVSRKAFLAIKLACPEPRGYFSSQNLI
jgi:hypothetical protein